MGPPRPTHRGWTLLAVLGPAVPLLVANLHQAQVPGPRLRSHDHLGLQLDRVRAALEGDAAPTRESLGNITAWLADPLGFLGRAYGVDDLPEPPLALALVGWGVVACALVRVWHRPHPTPRDALLRFSGIVMVLGVGGALLVARDLHHLATYSVVVALVVGLSADQLAGTLFPPRSRRRAATAVLLVLPWLATGTAQLVQTDRVVEAIPVPTFRRDGQAQLAEMIAAAEVETLWVCDYESMGAIELALQARAPHSHARVIHAWGAASRRARDAALRSTFTPDLLGSAVGAHLLVVQASAPMIYNLRARGRALDDAAEQAGVRLEEVGRLEDGSARLYAVTRADPQRAASP